jgi:hypothetical protein
MSQTHSFLSSRALLIPFPSPLPFPDFYTDSLNYSFTLLHLRLIPFPCTGLFFPESFSVIKNADFTYFLSPLVFLSAEFFPFLFFYLMSVPASFFWAFLSILSFLFAEFSPFLFLYFVLAPFFWTLLALSSRHTHSSSRSLLFPLISYFFRLSVSFFTF